MPREYTLEQVFADDFSDDEEKQADAPDAEVEREYTLEEAFSNEDFEQPEPIAQPSTPVAAGGGQRVPGVPYPVAPADAFGLPDDYEEPGAVTKFAEEFTSNLPDVTMDLVDATKGVIRDTLWEDMTPAERAAGKRLFEDLRTTQATRAPLQGAMQFSQAVQGAVNRPLSLLGVEGADENADRATRIVDALGQENSRRAATGLIAQAFGETAGQVSEAVISSLVEQYLGGRFLKGAKVASSPARAAMLYTGLAAGNDALTEATDMGLEGAKRWGYAGTIGAINSAFIALGGKIAKGLGVETVEEALFKPALNRALVKSGVKELLGRLVGGTTGAVLEGGEEYGTELTTGLTRAIFDGPPEGALDRIGRKLNDKEFQKNVALAGLTGFAARGALGTMQSLGGALQRAQELLPGEMAAEAAEQAAAPDGEQTGQEAPPAAPPEAQAGQTVPDQAQTAAPAAAPPEAPQGAPLTPEPEAAAVAPPSAEATAGVPPSEAPATPPGEAPAAEAAGETAEPAGTVPPVAPGQPTAAPPGVAEGIRMANAPMAELARMLGRGESYYSPGTRSLRETAELAVAAGVPDNAVDIATDVVQNKRVLTSVEEVGIGLRVQKIVGQLQQNRAQINSATEQSDIDSLAVTANRLNEEFDLLRDALERGGTDPARLLAYRRWMIPDDLTEGTINARMKTARKGPVTDADKKFAKVAADKHADNKAKLDKARAKQKEDIASAAIKAMKEEGASAQPLEDINARIRQLLDEGCDLV